MTAAALAPSEREAVADEAGLPVEDSLADCLLWITRHHGQERTLASLLSGQAADNPLRVPQAVAILRAAGFTADLVERAPEAILEQLLPAILLMRDGRACILAGRTAQGFELVWPSQDARRQVLDARSLREACSGHAIFAKPAPTVMAEDAETVPLTQGHWLWSTLWRYVPYYRSAMLAAMLSNVLMLATGLFSSVVFDRVIPHKAFVTLWTLAAGALLAIVFDLLARQIRSYLIDLAGKKADLALASKLFRQALAVRLEHRPASAGSFAHHVAQIELVRDFTASATLTALTDLPFVVLFVIVTFLIAGPLGWVLVLAIPLVLGLSWLTQRLLRHHMSNNIRQQAEMHGVLIEAIEGIEDVRASGAQGYFLKHHDRINAAATESALHSRALTAWANNFVMVSQQLVTVVLLVWGVHLADEGLVSGGAMVAAMMFSARAIAPLGAVVSLAARFQGARAALKELNRVMALPTEREAGRSYIPYPETKGALGLRDASFSYPPGRPGGHSPTVLKHVSLQIRPGDRVAILGRIGSGKSTMLRLLGGLYQPTEGMAEADGLDLRQIDPADFRLHVGLVSQEPRLFAGTLKDNILLGRPNARPAHFLEVLRLTGLDRMAAAHPMGLDLPVGEMGALLSGGQRQMVALARCLATEPSILLLDEPTSSMDAQAEMAFVQHLRGAVGVRTLVLVTHRPALLDLVDRVVVVDDGRVIADGPKAQVLAALAARQQQQQGAPA